MKRIHIVKGALVGLAVVGLCLPRPLLADDLSQARSSIVGDVALTGEGVLHGQVIDAQGLPIESTPVTIFDQNQRSWTTETDQHGRFQFPGLRGGVYQLVAVGGRASYRVWAHGTSPPTARQAALVVAGDEAVRGQGGLAFLLSNPWFIVAAVATAVAVPVAIHNSEPPASP
ncbi:MAG: carboxypeptidase regulatory-like domain-containing protein [Candidatus Nealsonbacteria bacterium]|nr:carboxypeptidase regulatory-like domain-containing protein [Candidatus Nealsonbacteria bacterium]